MGVGVLPLAMGECLLVLGAVLGPKESSGPKMTKAQPSEERGRELGTPVSAKSQRG